MHIIFGNVSFWQVPLLKLLKYFKLKISYVLIAGSELQRNEIANMNHNIAAPRDGLCFPYENIESYNLALGRDNATAEKNKK